MGVLGCGRSDKGNTVRDPREEHGEDKSTDDSKARGTIWRLNAAKHVRDRAAFLLHVPNVSMRGECVVEPNP